MGYLTHFQNQRLSASPDISRDITFILNNWSVQQAAPTGDAKTQIPMMHRKKTESGNPVLRPGQCY